MATEEKTNTIPDATSDTGLTVGQFKEYWASQNATPEEIQEGLARAFGGVKGASLWNQPDNVRIRDVPSEKQLEEGSIGKLPRIAGDKGKMRPISGEEMAHEMMREKDPEWLKERGLSVSKLFRYRDVPEGLTDKQAREFLDKKHRKETEEGRALPSAEKGYLPARDLAPVYAGEVAVPRTQAEYARILASSKARRDTKKWKSREDAYKELLRKQKQLRDIKESKLGLDRIVADTPVLGTGAEFVVRTTSEAEAWGQGLTTLALETADRWDIGFGLSDHSYAADVQPEQFAVWVKQMEDAYKAMGKEIPAELSEAIRRNQIKIAKFPALKGDYKRGEDAYEAGKELIRKDFQDILKKDRWIITDYLHDAGDIMEGLLTLATGAFGAHDSEWVEEARKSGDLVEWRRRIIEERSKFVTNLGHTALAAIAVMMQNGEDGSPTFLEQFEARPLSTWMTVSPVLRAIKYGSIKMGPKAQEQASMLLSKWEAQVASKLGPKKWNAMLNTVDAVSNPIRFAWAGAKGFIADRAAQAIPRATETMRHLFNQPIKTRAEHQARRRRARLKWEEIEAWMDGQGPKSSWTQAQATEFATRFDDLVKLFPEDEQAQVYMNIEKGMPDDLRVQSRFQDALDRVPRAGERGFIYQEDGVRIGPDIRPIALKDDKRGVGMPDEPLGELVARLEQQRRQSGTDREPVFVSTEKEFVDFGGGPSPRLFPDVDDGPRKRFDYWREPQYATEAPRPTVDFGGGPAARLYPDAPEVVFRRTNKGEISSGKRIEPDTPKTLHQVFRDQTDHVTGRRDPVTGAWEGGRRLDPASALQHVQRKVDAALKPSMDVELGVVKVPKDFVEPVIHIDPSDLRVNLMQSIGHNLPKGPSGMKVFEALVNTDKILGQYKPLKRSLYDVFEYGITGHRRGTTATTVNGRKVNLYVHPAVEQALNSLDGFMRGKSLSPKQIAALKKRNLNAARAKFNRAMREFRAKYTWDRSAMPESVNAMLDDIVNAGWPRHKRNAAKGKLLREHAPVSSFREWARKYHPDTPYEYIPSRNTSVIPEDVLADPAKLDAWLMRNPPGLEQFASQRGMKGKKHTALMKEWIDHPWPEEAHMQMVNYLRWADEGPRISAGKVAGWAPVPKDVQRKFPDSRIYGPGFDPYKVGRSVSDELPPPAATTAAGKRAALEEAAVVEGIPSPEHIQAMERGLGSTRPISKQEKLDIADMHRIQNKMAALMDTDGGVDKAASLLASEIEGTYQNKMNNAAKDRIRTELDHAEGLVRRGADDPNLSIDDLPGVIPMGPREWLAQFKPTTERGKLWFDMATRRLMPGTRIPVFKEGIYLNKGYTKIPKEMAVKIYGEQGAKVHGDVYMPNFAVRQWKWQRDALDAVFNDKSAWRQFTTYVKGNLTATNLPTLLYNLASNVGLQVLTRGPFFWKDMASINLDYRAFLKGKKFDKETQMMFEAIEDSGLLSTDFHRMELAHMADGVPDFRKIAEKKKGFKEYLSDVLYMRPLSKAYGGSDNLFKLHEAVVKMKEARKVLKKLTKPKQYVSMAVAPNKYVRFELGKVRGKNELFANGKMIKNEKELYSILAEHGRSAANLKFFDYSDLPGWNAILKGRRLDLLFSPFLTFTSKAMWLPGFKRGLGRELLSEMPYKTNIPGLIIKSGRDRMDTYAIWMAALGQARADYIEGSRDLKKVVSRNPQSTHMMLYDLVTNPETMWSRDLRSLDFLEGTKILANVVEDMFGTRAHHVEAFGEEDGPEQIRFLKSGAPRSEESREQLEEDWQEVAKHFPIHGATFDDIANNIGIGKGPLLDLLVESEAIGSMWWGHREMTPKRWVQNIMPLAVPGTWGKAIDVGAGLQQDDDPSGLWSYFTNRKAPMGATYGQVGETDEQYAKRKMFGIGMTSKPLEKAVEGFFSNLQKEWLARSVGTAETHGTLKYDAKYIWENTEIPEEERRERVREIKSKITRWQQLIKWSIANRKERAYAVIKKFYIRGTLKQHGKPK
jgi:hypothetical protein